MKKAFITGITGQDGAYLAKLLLEQGYEVIGGVRRNASQEFYRLNYLNILDKVSLVDFDLLDINNIVRTIRDNPVDEFYNLAAHSFVGSSWNNPTYVSDVNALGVSRILDTLKTYKSDTKFYQASTSEMFGKVQEVPQKETTKLYPRSPYGVSKCYSHFLTVNYRESFNMHASSGILFNHESPLRGLEFVTRKITHNLAKIALGLDTPLELGNINCLRDWGYAVDYVRGMWLMLQQDQADDYVLSTGKTITIKEFIQSCLETLDLSVEWVGEGLDEVAIDTKTNKTLIKINSKFYRPAEVEILQGDSSKANSVLNWHPTVSSLELAHIMAVADYDRIKRIQ
jgi:GDPmannose 4,6-dehydratase